MQFHMTNQPLIEEYSTARQVWDLEMYDLTEIARNSIFISFGDEAASELYGALADKIGADDHAHTANVSSARLAYRHITLETELRELEQVSNSRIEESKRRYKAPKVDRRTEAVGERQSKSQQMNTTGGRSIGAEGFMAEEEEEMDLATGVVVWARDIRRGKWCEAKVLRVDKATNKARLAYIGLSKRYDESIEIGSGRLRPLHLPPPSIEKRIAS